MSPADAERAARRRFGDVDAAQGTRPRRPHAPPSSRVVVRDVRHMGRSLGKSPGFALAVVLTLAIGIGANTAIFSVVDQLLLRPLPYPGGDRLVTVNETFPKVAKAIEVNSVSPANWLDWQRESRTFESLAAWRTATYTLTGVGAPMRIDAQLVSAEYFPLLGVRPLLGRTVTPDDDRPEAPRVVVLSHELWQAAASAATPPPSGASCKSTTVPMQIVGVMPAGFRFIYQETDVWTAYRLDRSRPWRKEAGRFMNVVGRLRPDATLATSRAEMDTIAARLSAAYEFNKTTGVRMTPLREALTGQVATSLLVLYAAVGVLLSIACFNVANLLLARSASRRREIAIRSSLGAGRLAILQQQVIESLLLAIVGGALGVLLARLSLDALVAFAPPDLLRVPAAAGRSPGPRLRRRPVGRHRPGCRPGACRAGGRPAHHPGATRRRPWQSRTPRASARSWWSARSR